MHSPSFLSFRNRVLTELDDEDRRRVAQLFGCMHEPKSRLSSPVVSLLRAFVDLSEGDRDRVVRWFGRYVSRWGQIPVAASQKVVTPAAGSAPISRGPVESS